MKFLLSLCLLSPLVAAEIDRAPLTLPAERMTLTIDEITYDFVPGDEALVRELARKFAEQRATKKAVTPPVVAAAVAPLTLRDFRLNRSAYLRGIAAAIGLANPTALQEECYDGFLDNFEATEKLFTVMIERLQPLMAVRNVTVMRKAEILAELKTGKTLPNFSLDPDGEHINFTWKQPDVNFQDDRLVGLFLQRENRRLDTGYNLSTDKDGTINFSAHTKILRRGPADNQSPKSEAAAHAPAAPPEPLELPRFPLVITPEQETLSLSALAEALAKSLDGLKASVQLPTGDSFQNPVVLANLLLHETVEIGVVERYIGSRDRRWFCEGVANYVAWKIARDRAGPEAARQIYDVRSQVAKYPDLRGKVNLKAWPTSENERKEDANTPLTKAHYAYAARAVFLMMERNGENFLPRFFQEIGRTPRAKTNMATVEKAYRKLAKQDLARVLDAALAPVATSDLPAGGSVEKTRPSP